jgi:hypothetical protein
MGADTFEAREGWVPANTEGSVWCYRTRGNAGVLAFRRTEDGQSLYEATHQDCYASDETITTTRRVDAVRFAVTGTGSSASEPAESPTAPTPESSPLVPPASASPTPADRAHAIRAAWDRYIDATSEFLEHIKANLDGTTHADLLGSVDHALTLVRDTTFERPDGEADPSPHDDLSATLVTVLSQARELMTPERVRS